MTDGLSTLADLFSRSEFVFGGGIGLVALLLIAFVTPDEKQRLEWGVVFAAAVLLAVGLTIGRRLGLMVGVSTLAMGGWLSRPPQRTSTLLGWALLVAGAVIVAWRGGLPDIAWVTVLTPVVILAFGAALAAWSTRFPQILLGPMIAVTAFGIWATVPDTEAARVILGVSLPLALGTVPPVRAKLGYAGAFAVAGVVPWAVAVGGEGRPASVIGGWACIGLIAILAMFRRPVRSLVERRALVVFLLHCVFVAVASRVIGMWDSVGLAVVAVVALGGAAFLLSRALTPDETEPAGAVET